MRVIFDLDGTLANAEHRVHHLTGEVKDWRAFYADCAKDDPIKPLVSIARDLAVLNWEVEIWTGRSAEVAEETEAWLAAQGLDDFSLRMRPIGDHQPDTQLKLSWLKEQENPPDLVFEDRASVVEMWRANGIICCQVAPGNF